jgi:hypothetical protein
MDIFNKLSISYQVESTEQKGELWNYQIFVEGERILIENSNFSHLELNDQLKIVNKFIEKHRLRYKTKKYINIRWEEIECVEKNALQQRI